VRIPRKIQILGDARLVGLTTRLNGYWITMSDYSGFDPDPGDMWGNMCLLLLAAYVAGVYLAVA
jgi:hypothetical protein